MMVEKGYLDALGAIRELRARLPDWHLEFHFAGRFIVGNDSFGSPAEMENDFRARCSALPCDVTVVWHGTVCGAKKFELLAACDAFVLPTYYRDEGQPIAVIEALASALPVVATEYRGIPEILPEEMRALCVPPKDPEAIARRLARLALDAEAYRGLSRAAVERSRAFSSDAHAVGLDDILTVAACTGAESQLNRAGNAALPD
jgi:glycosyltransferase involved in cell wall biosynthesis